MHQVEGSPTDAAAWGHPPKNRQRVSPNHHLTQKSTLTSSNRMMKANRRSAETFYPKAQAYSNRTWTSLDGKGGRTHFK